MSSPVRLDFEGDVAVTRWRPLANVFLAIPHLIIVSALQSLLGALTVIAFFTVLFTQAIPRNLYDTMVMVHRYQWRVTTFVLFMRESYPPFDFTPASSDEAGPPPDPARVAVEYPETLLRFAPLYKWFLAIPHYLALCFVGIGVAVALLVAFFAVIFTGRYPLGIRDFVVGYSRWLLRVQVYVGMMRDEYPAFSTQP